MQTVYVPVKASDRLPSVGNKTYQLRWINSGKEFTSLFKNGFFIGVSFLDHAGIEWLEPTEAVLLTKEDAKKIKMLISKQINRCSHVDLMLTNTIAEDLEQALTILNKNL